MVSTTRAAGDLPSESSDASRRRQACERCFRRKQKCDKLLPACTGCVDLGVKCEPRRWVFDKPLTPSKQKSGGSVSASAGDASAVTAVTNYSVREYVESLKRQIDMSRGGPVSTAVPDSSSPFPPPLRERKRRRTDSSTFSASSRKLGASTGIVASYVSPSSSRNLDGDHDQDEEHTEGQPGGQGQESLRAVCVDDGNNSHGKDESGQALARNTMGDIGLLSRSAMAEPHHYHSYDDTKYPRNLMLDKMVGAALALDGVDPARALPMDASRRRRRIMAPPDRTLDPSRESLLTSLDHDTAFSYLTLFIDHVCPQHVHLDKNCVVEQFQAVVGENRQPDGSHEDSSDPLIIFNTYIAVAVGASLSSDAATLAPFISRLHSAAAGQLPAIAKTNDVLAMLRCLLNLAIFASYTPYGGSMWHLVGLVMKKCITWGLHKEPDVNDCPPEEATQRRRLFWSAYLLDRTLSNALGRPFGIPDEDITVRMLHHDDSPGLEDDEEAYKIHLLHQGRLASNIRSSARDERLTTTFDYPNLCFWREPSSAIIGFVRSNRNASDHLEQLVCRALVQLTWPASLSVPHHPGNHDVIDDDHIAVKIQVDTLACCRRLIDRCYEQSSCGRLKASFVDAYDIFYAGVAFAYLSRQRCIHEINQPQSPRHHHAQSVEVIQKCSTVVTILSEQFSSLRIFQRILLLISTALMSISSSGDLYGKAFSVPQELPPMISDQALRMVEGCL